MMFDIPIQNNVKPALGLDSLMAGNLGGQASGTPQMGNQNGFNQGMQAPQIGGQNGFNQGIQSPQMNPQMNNQNGFNQGMQTPQMNPQMSPQIGGQNGFNQGMQTPQMNPQMGGQNGFNQGMQTPQMNPQMNSQPKARPNGGGVILSKGQKFNLATVNPNLDFIEVGLGWDAPMGGTIPYDLDAEAFMLGANGKVLSDDWFIFYNQPNSPDGSCNHLGDSSNGAGAGDDEVIQLQLSRVNPQVQKIAFVITINEALQRGHNFGGVQNAYVRVTDKSTGKEMIRFNLTDCYKEVTSMTVGELYRKDGTWRFNAVGQGLNTDLAGLCGFYGVNIGG